MKDHGDVVAADLAEAGVGDVEKVFGSIGVVWIREEEGFAAGDLAGRHGEEAEQGEGGDALAAAGFTDDAEGFAWEEVEGETIDGAELAGIDEERGAEVLYLEDGGTVRQKGVLRVPEAPVGLKGERIAPSRFSSFGRHQRRSPAG